MAHDATHPPAVRRRSATAWAMAAVAWTTVPAVVPAAAPPRDWSGVQLAWRDDPRPTSDLPAGGEPQPRRPSRRATRRALRRGVPPEQPSGGEAAPVVPGGPPIDVRSTLGSPFAPPAPDVLAHRDQPYGGHDDPCRRFDLHLPAACSAGGLPLIVWIAGDDWLGGRRSDCPLVWLVDRGYAVASVGHRPCDAAIFPAQLDDCRAAVATLVRDARTWGVDPARICVVGRGAGGHLAALVALADPPAGAAVEVAAACAVGAPADLASLGPAQDRANSPASRLVGGPLPELREAARSASPLAHVSRDDPPLLLVHGGRDAEVAADQSVRLDRSLKDAGVESRLVLLDAAGHDLPLGADSDAGRALLEFLDGVLGPGGRSGSGATSSR